MTPIVVLLQNDRLYADCMEQMFIELGYCLFCMARDAKSWPVDHDPDVALIDAEVDAGDCIKLACRLKARSGPFVGARFHRASQGMCWL